MAKNSIDAYGASGKTNVLMFEPEKLHLVTDKTTRFTMNVSTCLSRGDGAEHHGGVLEPIIVWKDPKQGYLRG
jgi:ParB family chromosome partitioning protein